MNKEKKYTIMTISCTLLILFVIAFIMVYVDPVFHFHGPREGMAYQFWEGERYINDGIVRHFDYDAIITGSSMTENFKTSECDEIFGVTSVKVPFAGAYYKEVNENLERAFETHKDIKMVIRCMDTFNILRDKDDQRYEDNPTYLTNDNPFDDVKYIFNKQILGNAVWCVAYSLHGEDMKSLDDYASWGKNQTFGKEYILKNYNRGVHIQNDDLTEDEIRIIEDNVNQNLISTIEENPKCEFYLFFQPSSVLHYDYLLCNGDFYKIWQGEQLIVEKLLQYDNVKIYGWANQYALTTDLDEYRDISHYLADTNSKMLDWMKKDVGLLNADNYKNYFKECIEFYEDYDYDSIFE